MFDALDDQMRIDEQKATTTRQRVIRYSMIGLLSVILFGGLYYGIAFFSGS